MHTRTYSCVHVQVSFIFSQSIVNKLASQAILCGFLITSSSQTGEVRFPVLRCATLEVNNVDVYFVQDTVSNGTKCHGSKSTVFA